jgi:DNA primase
MMGHVPDSFIEMLLSRVDILDIISERVLLRKAGANSLGLCPFHGEKTPSFSVNASKQFYHCFGCNASGDAIAFLKAYDGLSFVEAIEVLAARLGVEVPRDTQAQGSSGSVENHALLYEWLGKAAQFYQTQLRENPAAAKAIQYLKGRGLTGLIAKKFGIGFAPPAWDSLLKSIGKPQGEERDLILAGLVIRKDAAHCYDRFRDRIMFPIRDKRGRVVGFGGRVSGIGEPKYLNSPETPVFSKGTELYGLYEARQENRTLSTLIVVEGYLDVVSLAQFGISNTVATLGTAFSEKHLETLFRTVPEIILCFDGDKAGREAALRAMKICLPQMKEGRRVRFTLLPEGSDPDSLVRTEGTGAFLDRLQHSQPLSDFLFDTLTKSLDLRQIDGRAELINLAKPLLALLPVGVFQQMMWDRLGELSGFSAHRIHEIQGIQPVSENNLKKVEFRTKFPNSISKSRLPLVSPAIRAVAILGHYPMLVDGLKNRDKLKEVDIPGISLLCALVDLIIRQPTITKEAIKEQLSVEWEQVTNWDELSAIVESIPDNGMEQELIGAIQRLDERAQEQAMEILLGKARVGELSATEKTRLKFLLDKREQDRVE